MSSDRIGADEESAAVVELGEGALYMLAQRLQRPSTTPSHPSRSVRTQPQTLTSRVRMPVESIQTRESLLTIFARTLSQCGQRRTMPAPR